MAGRMNKTLIEWATHTINPVTGCSPVSEGCENCFAKRMANRLRGRAGYPEDEPFRVTFHSDKLDQILRFQHPARVFVGSMTDLWHPDVWPLWRALIFDRIQRSTATFMVLTKRPELLLKDLDNTMMRNFYGKTPNLWFGVTAENQARADERIPPLLEFPAAVRFVSVEPMLGPVDLSGHGSCHCPGAKGLLDWVICGAETGPGARPMNPEWAWDLRDQCAQAGVPFFFKKWSMGRQMENGEMPREFPEVR